MKKDLLFEKAVSLREQGYSYKEIHKELKISKATAHEWTKKVPLTTAAIQRLSNLSIEGRKTWFAGSIERRAKRDQLILDLVLRELTQINFTHNIYFLLCSVLYWAEGAKSKTGVVGFTNSDPVMVKTFLFLFRKSFNLDESKLYAWLHLHEYHNREEQLEYWANITQIPKNRISVYLKPNTGKVVRQGYPGCIRICYGDVIIFQKIKACYTLLPQIVGG